MKRVLISPYSSKIPGDKDAKSKVNAKNYPYWKELVKKLVALDCEVLQLGVSGEKQIPGTSKLLLNSPMSELKKMLDSCDFWISVDNFFHHFAHFYKKPGFVLWGPSDPSIFGYSENVNILRSKKYLRPPNEQFLFWKWVEYKQERFVSAESVIDIIKKYIEL